jgi:hypothetical protein
MVCEKVDSPETFDEGEEEELLAVEAQNKFNTKRNSFVETT